MPFRTQPAQRMGTNRGRPTLNATIEHWKSQLVALPPGDRAELAHFLLTSLDPEEDDDAESARDEEAARRVKEIRSGQAVGRPVDELLAELREQFP